MNEKRKGRFRQSFAQGIFEMRLMEIGENGTIFIPDFLKQNQIFLKTRKHIICIFKWRKFILCLARRGTFYDSNIFIRRWTASFEKKRQFVIRKKVWQTHFLIAPVNFSLWNHITCMFEKKKVCFAFLLKNVSVIPTRLIGRSFQCLTRMRIFDFFTFMLNFFFIKSML